MDIFVSGRAMPEKVSPPSFKSEFIRALFLAAFGEKKCTINFIGEPCDDVRASIKLLSELGADISIEEKSNGSTAVIIPIGKASCRKSPLKLVCFESAALMRFTAAFCAVHGIDADIEGKRTLVKRDMSRDADELSSLGVTSSYKDGVFSVRGSITSYDIALSPSVSSQLASGFMLALSAFGKGSIAFKNTPVSFPYLELTNEVILSFGGKSSLCGQGFSVTGKCTGLSEYTVHSDPTGAAAVLVFAAASKKKVTVSGLSDPFKMPDGKIIRILKECGFPISETESGVMFDGSVQGKAFSADFNDCPDLFPSCAVLAAIVNGESRLTGLSRLWAKEISRADKADKILRSHGIKVLSERDADGRICRMTITGGTPLGTGDNDPEGDHRTAMALAALAASCGGFTVKGAECVSKSYPAFFRDTGCTSEGAENNE